MSTEVAKKEASEVAEYQGNQAPNQALAGDVLIPKVLIMQGLSDLVAERKAVQGDIVRSTTAEKLGDDKTPLEFIPLSMKNAWILQEKVGGKYEFRRSVPRSAMAEKADESRIETEKQSENLPWDFKFNGADWKRVKSIDLFALLPRDIAAFKAEVARAQAEGDLPDLEKVIMPVLISFRSTGFAAGRTMATHFSQAASMGAPAHGYVRTLSCFLDKNDKGSYYVPTIGKMRACTKEEFQEANKWAALISSTAVQVHEVDEEAAPAQAAPKSAPKPDRDMF